MKTRYVNACLALLLWLPTMLFARDLPKSDPDRAAILDAARGQETIKFIVKDLVRDGNYAYLCALKTETGGGVIGTDDALDVYQWGFIRLPDGWLPYPLPSGFAESRSKVECKPALSSDVNDIVQSASDIQDILRAALEDSIRRNMDFGGRDKLDMKLLHALADQHIITDVDIEHGKDLVDRDMLTIANERCKTQACRAENGKAFDAMAARQRDRTVSSLAWNGCQYGRRVFSSQAIVQCVDALASKSYCRPGMKLLKDSADIDKCVQAAHQQCRQTFTDPNVQLLACS